MRTRIPDRVVSKDIDDNVRVIHHAPSLDEVSSGLVGLTRAIHAAGLADGSPGGILGGEFGYGANYENDVFLLHRYCWCERDDCLWCGGSGCQAEIPRDPHGAACYQTRLDALRRKHGRRETWGGHVPFDHKDYERDKRALCKELKRSFKLGNEVHCTCGADARWRRRYNACECDWHMGRGVFRFGPAAEAPHFWHKPSGSAVRWYKYIGRGMEVDLRAPWSDILAACHGSLTAAPASPAGGHP